MPSFIPLVNRFLKKEPKQESLPGVEISKKIEKERQRRSRKNGRLAIVGVFLFTVLASLFFYLKTELPLILEKTFSPMVISTLPEGSVFDPSLAANEFKSLTKALLGDYGFYVYRLDSSEAYGTKEDEVFTAASLIKLPVMLTVYQKAGKGTFKLEDYREKLEAMGKRSDNVAFNQMVNMLGEETIQRTIDSLGMTKTSLVENKTSPADIGLFFQKLYRGKLISKEHQEEFLSFLTDTVYEDRIPAGVPEGIRVAHKIGTEMGSFSDAGIIFAEKPFVLVIMSDGAREAEANEALPKVARAIWDFENQGN